MNENNNNKLSDQISVVLFVRIHDSGFLSVKDVGSNRQPTGHANLDVSLHCQRSHCTCVHQHSIHVFRRRTRCCNTSQIPRQESCQEGQGTQEGPDTPCRMLSVHPFCFAVCSAPHWPLSTCLSLFCSTLTWSKKPLLPQERKAVLSVAKASPSTLRPSMARPWAPASRWPSVPQSACCSRARNSFKSRARSSSPRMFWSQRRSRSPRRQRNPRRRRNQRRQRKLPKRQRKRRSPRPQKRQRSPRQLRPKNQRRPKREPKRQQAKQRKPPRRPRKLLLHRPPLRPPKCTSCIYSKQFQACLVVQHWTYNKKPSCRIRGLCTKFLKPFLFAFTHLSLLPLLKTTWQPCSNQPHDSFGKQNMQRVYIYLERPTINEQYSIKVSAELVRHCNTQGVLKRQKRLTLGKKQNATTGLAVGRAPFMLHWKSLTC